MSELIERKEAIEAIKSTGKTRCLPEGSILTRWMTSSSCVTCSQRCPLLRLRRWCMESGNQTRIVTMFSIALYATALFGR